LGLILFLAAVMVAADWWFTLPEGEQAEYVGHQACVDCHQDEVDAWTGSDHDLAMDPATPDNVLGDFDDCEFHHVAFQDLTRLSASDLQALVAEVAIETWAVALDGADEKFIERVEKSLSATHANRLSELRQSLGPVRPCDVTDAHQAIGDAARELDRAGKISVDFGVRSRLWRQDGKFFATTDNRRGEMETFHVKYTFGVRPLQQYLVEFPDGRVQCLPMAWDTEKDRWFHLYPSEPIPHDDPLHWTRQYQNWNYMCAECHSTNLQKNYNLAEDTYHTSWSDIDVNCETCHGPGSLHVKLAEKKKLFWDRRYGYGLPNLKDEQNPRVEIETCAPCHSRRRIVHPGYQAGEKFLDYYMLQLLDGNLYYADGQILEEDYVYGSFVQSRMYREKVRCTDCHDPHTARVKFDDNRLCNQCHVAAKYDTVQHHHHPDESKPGRLCVECHMPETKYMVADPRRDHSLRVPRPDLTISLDIPNACNLCHNDPVKGENAEWAEDKVREWYGQRDEPPHFAHAFAAARELKPEGEDALVAVTRRKDTSAIVRASAILLLSRYASGAAQAAAFAGLEDPEALVRVASIQALDQLPPPELHRRVTFLLKDPVRAVRSEAARVLSQVPLRDLSREESVAFKQALLEFMEGQHAVNDRAGAHLNLGVLFSNLQEYQKALQSYQTALRLDPDFIPGRVNLAMLSYQMGDKAEAERQYRKVIKLEPELADAYYSLGLLLGEDESRLEETAELLTNAARLAPQSPRMHYNAGLALQKLGSLDEAEQQLLAAHRLAPRSADFLFALMDMYVKQERWPRAVACAEQLVKLQPGNPRWQALLEQVQTQADSN
jgi:predicted CXXCH cytochrome family protein